MKKTIIATYFLVYLSLMLYSQKGTGTQIVDSYKMLSAPVYYLIDKEKIVRVDFCDICDDKIYIDTASYNFTNDTLTFFMRDDIENIIDTVKYVWIYKNIGVGFFADYELGEYIRTSPKVINSKLRPFGLKLIDN